MGSSAPPGATGLLCSDPDIVSFSVHVNDYVLSDIHWEFSQSTGRPEIISSCVVSPVSRSRAGHTAVRDKRWEHKHGNSWANKTDNPAAVTRLWAFGPSFWGSRLNVFFPFLHLGTLIVLKHPYPRKVEEPSIYESVRVHTAMQTGRTENDLVPTAPSVSGCPSAIALWVCKGDKVQEEWCTNVCPHKNSHLGYNAWKAT